MAPKKAKPKSVFLHVKNGELIGNCELHGEGIEMIIKRHKTKKDKDGQPQRYYACRLCESK